MKVALIGAGCTGKTAVVARVGAAVDGAVVVPDAARSWLAVHPGVTGAERYDVWMQGQIQALVIQQEEVAEEPPFEKNLICDRSVLCAPVYLAAHGHHDAAATLLDAYVSMTVWSYDTLWLCDPADVPYRPGADRYETEAERARMHAAYLHYLTAWGIPFRLLQGPRAVRVETVVRAIRYAQPPPEVTARRVRYYNQYQQPYEVFEVDCPYCANVHTHSTLRGEGEHREAHCLTNPELARIGYLLREQSPTQEVDLR